MQWSKGQSHALPKKALAVLVVWSSKSRCPRNRVSSVAISDRLQKSFSKFFLSELASDPNFRNFAILFFLPPLILIFAKFRSKIRNSRCTDFFPTLNFTERSRSTMAKRCHLLVSKEKREAWYLSWNGPRPESIGPGSMLGPRYQKRKAWKARPNLL